MSGDLVNRLLDKAQSEAMLTLSGAEIIAEAAARITALEAENKRLREALEPFAKVNDQFPWVKPEAEEGTFLWTDGRSGVSPVSNRISIGALRRAAAALEKK